MIIERLDLIAFGRFTNEVLDLSGGPIRLHIVYGPNESGKSTSMRAIQSLLFGMPQRSDDNFIHPYGAMRIGGRFRDATSGEVVECIRRRGRSKTLMGPGEVDEVDPMRLAAMLRGVDAETFSRQFGISHQELVSGGRAILDGAGDLGEMLFAAGTGTGTLRSARQQLEKERRELFIERGSTGAINKLISRFQDTDIRLRACRLLPMQYDAKYKTLDQAIIDATALDQKLKDHTQSYRLLEAFLKARRLLPDRTAIIDQLQTDIGSTPLLDEAFITLRRQLETSWHSTSQQLVTQGELLAELINRRDLLQVDDRWLAAAPSIKSLMNELSEIESGQLQLHRYQTDLVKADQDISTAIKRLGHANPMPVADQSAAADGIPDPLAITDTIRHEIDAMVTRYGGLLEGLQAAEEQEQLLRQAFDDITDQLNALPTVADLAPLTEAINAIGKPLLLFETAADCRIEADKSLRRVHDAIGRLRGFSGGIDKARTLLPPPSSQIAQRTAAITKAKQELQQCEATVALQRADLTEAELRFSDESSNVDLPTLEQRDAARAARDVTIDQLQRLVVSGQTVNPHLATAIADQVRLADQITDALHAAYDQVIHRKRLIGDIDRAKQRLDAAYHQQELAQQQLDFAVAQWQELWRAEGVDPGDPDEMRQWTADLNIVRELISHCDEKQAAVRRADESIEHAIEHLRTAMRVSGDPRGEVLSLLDSLDLTELYSLATQQRDAATRRYQRQVELQAEQTRAQIAMKKGSDECRKRKRQWDQWQSRWVELTVPLPGSDHARPETIHAMIRQVDDLMVCRQKRDTLSEAYQSLEQRCNEYLDRVQDIAKRLDLTFETRDSGEFVRNLARQVEHYLTQQNEQKLLNQQIDALKLKLEAAKGEEINLASQLKQLCCEAGCENISQLPIIEQASIKRRELEKELKAVDQQLRALAESQPLQKFIDSAAQYDSSTLEIEIAKADVERERLQQDWTAAQQLVGKLRGEVEQMDASDQAAMIQQERQNLLATIRRHANRYAELTIAEETLKQAIEHYRENNEGPVLRLASDFFNRMTDGEYDSLQVEFDDKDQPKLVGMRPNKQTSVMANLMSDGTADALYLSLRLASLEVHLSTHHPIPLIVDDCLVQFDDDRAAAALRILSDLATRTQVILFTHHQHLLDLAHQTLPLGGFYAHRMDRYLAS